MSAAPRPGGPRSAALPPCPPQSCSQRQHDDEVTALDLLAAPIASRSTVPPVGAVIAASIFMASMVATVSAGRDVVALGHDLSVTTPANGAATWRRLGAVGLLGGLGVGDD